MFKKWRNEYPQSTMEFDSRFISYMPTLLFDRETLARSSANGGIANNVGTAHYFLDPVRLKFLKGGFYREYSFLHYLHFI